MQRDGRPMTAYMRHRGWWHLVIAIISLPFIMLPLAGVPLGWSIIRAAKYDLALMNDGYMDPTGLEFCDASKSIGWAVLVGSAVYSAIYLSMFAVPWIAGL